MGPYILIVSSACEQAPLNHNMINEHQADGQLCRQKQLLWDASNALVQYDMTKKSNDVSSVLSFPIVFPTS